MSRRKYHLEPIEKVKNEENVISKGDKVEYISNKINGKNLIQKYINDIDINTFNGKDELKNMERKLETLLNNIRIKLGYQSDNAQLENILEKSPCNYALADKFGDESLIKNALMQKGRNIILNQMVRAEADIAVAAASVLARAEFVKRMAEMEQKYEMTFSKGVSANVIEQAQKFADKYSKARLNEVAKMHFKTAGEI